MLKKTFFLGTVLIFLSAVFLTSCNNDNGNDVHLKPTITLLPDQDTIYIMAGDTVNYQLDVTSDDELISVKLTSKMGTNQMIVMDSTLPSGHTNFNRSINIIYSDSIDAGTVGMISAFAATSFESDLVEHYVKVMPGMATYTDVTLQAQADGPTTVDENLSFYSATTNERFTYSEAATDQASQMIDLVFIHHSIYKTNAQMSFQSPDEQNLVDLWQNLPLIPFQYDNTNKNTTYFKRLTNVDWGNLDHDAIAEEIGTIGVNTIIRDLNAGDYIGFLTDSGKYGIIMVTATDPEHNPYTDATVTFDVKVQQ